MPASLVASFSSNYIPYGVEYAASGSEAFHYTGKLIDTTGLYYEGARYYDPTTGRFVTEDSVVGTSSDPQSLNRYVYARDNPMKIVDMNGHEWWDPVADLVSAAAGDVAGAAMDVENAVSNAWNSLPPSAQDAIMIGAAIAVVAGTGGAAAPIMLATAAIGGGMNAGITAASEVASGRSVNTNAIISGFSVGFAMGAIPLMGEEADAGCFEGWVSSLTSDQFDGLVRSEDVATYRTDIVQARLDNLLDGSNAETHSLVGAVEDGYRQYDVTGRVLGELKFGADDINSGQLSKDVAAIQNGLDIRYYFIDDPMKGTSASQNAIDNLEYLGIPYTHLTWDEFLRW